MAGNDSLVVGVLGLQGDVEEHLAALEKCERGNLFPRLVPLRVKTPQDVEKIDGLIVPGGESTTVGAMLERFDLSEPIKRRVREGMPVWGTCMGMIVMADKVAGSQQPTLGLLHIEVKRNAFGRQIESAEVPLEIAELGERPFPGVFIRAPWIESAGKGAKVLASLDGKGVMVRQNRLLGTSFHPELTDDLRVHKYFLGMVAESKRANSSSRGNLLPRLSRAPE